MMANVNMNTQPWTDPKEAIVNLNNLISMVEKLQNNTKNDLNKANDNTPLTPIALITTFINYIEKDFRKQYPNHSRPIGFDYWWQDNDGTRLFGIVKDADLFVYLCDAKRYPTKLENFSIKSDPPKRLPPQFTVVIKFVNNNIETDDIREVLKNKYNSTFTVENMLGGMRMNNRHIRADFTDKKDYESILNCAVIGIQGQLFDVDEYLPAPKILICTKCNIPGHTKTMPIFSRKVQTMWRCPSLLDFRRRLIDELRQKPESLPAEIQFFIPADCRPKGNTNRILSNTIISCNEENVSTKCIKGTNMNAWPNLPVADTHTKAAEQMMEKQLTMESKISNFSKELAELKQNYIEDQRKIEQRFQEQIKNIQSGWIAIQNQVSTQNEMISSTCDLIKDVLFDSCEALMNMMTSIIQETKSRMKSEDKKEKFESMDNHLKLLLSKLNDKKQLYLQFQDQLNQLTLRQHTAALTTMNSLFSSSNNE
ncbi:hypothetical protein I4U23_004490 [Adineta vaga]|nr:hypothetical protein I4U23_004490 [Adineta vaga]